SNKPSSITDHFGNKIFFEYNTAGRTTQITLPDNSVLTYEYDNCGRPIETTDPLGNKWHFTYRNDGKMLSRTTPDNSSTCYEYGDNGQLQSATLSSATEPLAYLYEYDSVLSLSSIQMPSGRKIAYTNDCFGRRIATMLPLGQSASTRYETPGMLPLEHTDFAGNCIRLDYDTNGKPVNKAITPPGENAPEKLYHYRYFPTGRLASATLEHGNRSNQISCLYDDSHRLSSFSNRFFTANHQYDLDGRLSAFATDNTSFSIARSKNNPQSVTTFTKAAGRILTRELDFTTTYDSCGRIHSITSPDSMVRQYGYDTAGNLSTLTFSDRTCRELYRFSCIRDSSGRLNTSSENLLNLPIQKEFTYDEFGRLASETRHCNGKTESTNYSYDKDGNLSQTVSSISRNAPECRFYDENGRLIRIEEDNATTILMWDDNGSLLQLRNYDLDNRLISSQSFKWDCEGLLLETVETSQAHTLSTAYEYDARGLLCGEQCMEETPTSNRLLFSHRYFHYAPEGKGIPLLMEIEELNSDGHVIHRQANVWENGLAGYFKDGIFHSCICDQGGSVVGIGSPDGSWTCQQYTAWGQPLLPDETTTPGPAYRGELYSPASGLLYLRSRFYMPKLGIFISADRYEPNLNYPKEINRYAYCRNDPVNRVDPLGTFSILAMSMNMNLSLAIGIFTGISMELTIGIIYTAYLSKQMSLEFLNEEKESPNATVIVHGVWKHEPGYASDFVNRLQRYAPDQDYLQFRWSGFGGILPMFIPNYYQHDLAQRNLEYCLGTLKAKGYANINVIGHSWGTVLSKDALNSGVINVGLWATMGSPLACENQFDDNGDPFISTSFPLFNHEKWMNFYNLIDPVVHLCMNGPLIGMCGVGISDNDSLSSPIFESPLPEQYNLGIISPDVHGCYWYNPTTILAITLFTRLQ
ncbi:MAG: RHS repeat protein, partial [Victivallales bacterium]|nr:RHS repeat protein [Victivallales bacterium]